MKVATAQPKRKRRQDREEVYVHYEWLDKLLTILFFVTVCGIVVVWWGNTFFLLTFPVATLVVGAVLTAIAKYSGRFGQWFSKTYLANEPFDNPLGKSASLAKFSEQSWQLAIHVSMSIFELFVLADEPWFDAPDTIWEPCPWHQTTKPSLMALYLVQLSIWVYTAISHRFLEKHRKKDYYVMFTHHIVTILLIVGSGFLNYYRVGLLVLFLHDVSDIPIDIMKMTNMCKLEEKEGYFVTEIVFALNLVSWVVFRLWLYPSKVIYTTLVRCVEPCVPGFWKNGEIQWWDLWNLGYLQLNALLVVLLLLHVYWFILLLRILYKILFVGEAPHDVAREAYEGGSDDEKEE